MRTLACKFAVPLAVLFLPGLVRPAGDEVGTVEELANQPAAGDGSSLQAAAPQEAPPSEAPPAAPAQPPLPPAQPGAVDEQQAAAGQWVYTQQYGWVWMPYDDAYSYAPSSGEGEPYEYVYYPSYGWTWVVAPWVWGWGPWPSFGVWGPWRFAWYGHGWWRSPWRWHFRPGPAFHGNLAFRGAPVRGGFAPRGFRSAPGGGGAARGSFGGHPSAAGRVGAPGGHR